MTCGERSYLSHSIPDISFTVSMVSCYMHDPRKGHMDAIYLILRYLKSALGKRLIFKKNEYLDIEGYCDSDWSSCADDIKSTSGYYMFVGSNLISWKNKKQSVVVRSTTKAEYRAMALGVAEMLWLKTLLVELKVDLRIKIKLWCDNKSVISITNNLVQHYITKHVKIGKFFIKEKLNNGQLKLRHVATKKQVIDCLTKGLSALDLSRLCDKICLIDIFRPS
jgi:hypothetical protein